MTYFLKSSIALNRKIYALVGEEASVFWQKMTTQTLRNRELNYGFLLKANGNLLLDFFQYREADAVYIDIDPLYSLTFEQEIRFRKLTSRVELKPTELKVYIHPTDGFKQGNALPYHRLYTQQTLQCSLETHPYTTLRLLNGQFEASIDLRPNDPLNVLPLTDWNGFDFTKGCYIGQETISKMRHQSLCAPEQLYALIHLPIKTNQSRVYNHPPLKGHKGYLNDQLVATLHLTHYEYSLIYVKHALAQRFNELLSEIIWK